MRAVAAAAGALATLLPFAAVPLLLSSAPAASAAGCFSGASVDGQVVPAGVEQAARTASQRSGVDELVLLAVTFRETRWGQARAGVPDDVASTWLGPVARDVDRSSLATGGVVATLVGRPDGVALGDWVDPVPVGAEHAVGFAQLLPSTWMQVAAAHPRPGGGAWDPYSPLDAMTLAGYELSGLIREAGGDVADAAQRYGTAGFPSALEQLRASCPAAAAAGDPFGGRCRPKTLLAYGAPELIAPDGRHHGIDVACQEGAAIFSVTAGQVFDVASGCANGARDACGAGYGNHVVVRFRGQLTGDVAAHDYYVVYGHLLTTPLVSRGETVEAGTPLGQQGDSGLSWGSHLHFEVDRDAWQTLRSVDPTVLLPPSISRTSQD